ncbi:MAG: right-handed parallel beta-helix repeat-containing protein, partial [Planctomycetes bacterium]|nr:right-handed parallel beta-helix repeat-containing protein [Planctomycetota bacterium]
GPTGVPVGDPLPCDIALTINETRTFVANFRSTFVAGLPAVLHVRSSAPSGGDGLSWATAFNDIQRALCRAGGSNGAVQEIWVSQGTYRPDAGTGRRDVGFILANGIALYGGFVGTEISRDQRDPAAHVTTLSGDIGTAGVATDNSYHVVVGSGTDATAVLDGFTITGGYVDTADFPGNTGGGLLVENGAPTIANCVFVGNYAGQGGGAVGNHQASPTLTNCTFDSNSGGEYAGGAVLNYSLCNPTITGCTFQSNSAVFAGAILNAFTSSPTITGCTFDQNSTTGVNQNGGAIYNYTNSSPAIGSCTFTANQADYGAAIGNAFDCSPAITNCVFRANVAAGGGAGVDTYSNCNVALTNCLFSGNVADFGAAVTMFASSNINFVNCTIVGNQAGFAAGLYGDSSAPTLANCILWANNDVNGTIEWSQIYMASGTPTLQYCTVQSWTGGLGGTANNGTNPQFVDADGPDNVYGTADDNPRLQAASPCVNTGNNAALPGGTTTDLDGGPRILSGTVDRGAYEYVPAIPGDSDHDGDVDDADLAAFINCGTGPSIGPPAPDCAWADLDGDNDVDSADFARFQRCISGADGAGDPNCAGL